MLIDPKDLPQEAELKEFFFASMNTVGYALGSAPVQKHPLIKGWKIIIHSIPLSIPHFGGAQLVFTDSWSKENGRTTITIRFEDIPATINLWSMIYRGKYPSSKETDVVKSVLRNTYAEKNFCGGRGVPEYIEGSLRYHNAWHGDFDQFWGEEELYDDDAGPGNEWRGSHRYWGGLFNPTTP